MKLSTAILAGGKSIRTGQNNALLQCNNHCFINKIVKELSGFSETLVSTAVKGDYEDLGLPMVYDERQDIGPMEGICQVLKCASEEYVFICGADMPFIKKELVAYMAEQISPDYDCLCFVDEKYVHPLCAIYSKKVLTVIEGLIAKGQYRLIDILNSVRTKYIRLECTDFDKKVVKNINTKNKYVLPVFSVQFGVGEAQDCKKTWLMIKLINEFIQENQMLCLA